MVIVYFFKQHQVGSDEWPRSKRRATLEAIARLGGKAIMDSGLEVEASRLDFDGFLADEGPESRPHR